MKLRTRLIITFLTIIILPLLLTNIAFTWIGTAITKSSGKEYGIEVVDSDFLSTTINDYALLTEELFLELSDQVKADSSKLEDKEFLMELEKQLQGKASYIIVRKEKKLYYTGNQEAAEIIFPELPSFSGENYTVDTGYYFSDMQKFVRQLDFTFQDGDRGSIFVITKVNTTISKTLLVDMFIAIIFILLFTSFMLTRWIHKGIYLPILDLNKAMQNIAEGNLDFSLSTNLKGELGSLYKNYEDMRLRLKETTEEKIESDRLNKELISNISHDLKTPITAIKGYVEGIMDGVADTPEKTNKYIKTIYTKANDMDNLINELTIYSKINSNKIPYNFHRINVSDYFNDCIEEVGLELESKNIKLNYSNLLEPNTRIIADPEQIKRVINNIVGNSIKYMDKKKALIDIRILDEINSIRVEIEDNGKGIPTRELTNIFERFYRTDFSRNSAQGGSGIGLSIVKKIIEDHGGYIWATSKEGEGTCLHFVVRKYKEAEGNDYE